MNASTRLKRSLTGIGFLAVLAYTCYSAMGTNVFGILPWPKGGVDYHLFYDFSRQIAQTHVYPAKHAYPPPAVALHYLLAQIPFSWSLGIFMGMTILATMACWWLLLSFFRSEDRPGWLILALPAFAVSQYYILWDLRSQNCNMIVCAVTLAGIYALYRQRAGTAGFCVALSFSLKLVSALLLPYLLWRGNYRAFAWTLVFLALFWIIVPLAVFGSNGWAEIYHDWFRQMRNLGRDQADLDHPILISLHNAAHLLFNGNPLAVGWLVNAFRFTWLVLGVFAALASWVRRNAVGDAHGLLADAGLLLLAPVAVSPYLEPYHAVCFIIPAFLLMESATDGRQSFRLRLTAGATVLVLLVARPGIFPFPYRGVPINLALLLAVAVSLWLTSTRQSESAPPQLPI